MVASDSAVPDMAAVLEVPSGVAEVVTLLLLLLPLLLLPVLVAEASCGLLVGGAVAG